MPPRRVTVEFDGAHLAVNWNVPDIFAAIGMLDAAILRLETQMGLLEKGRSSQADDGAGASVESVLKDIFPPRRVGVDKN